MSQFTFQHIPTDAEAEFIDRSCAELEQIIADAIVEKGKCILGLSGGSTPRPIYEALGQLVAVEWEKVAIFLVDERYVSSDDRESNQKLVRDTLLLGPATVRIRESGLCFPDTSLLLEECIDDYGFRIDQLMNEGIDAVILGLGEDGHIASLFPGDIDAIVEKEKRVLHTMTDQFTVKDRITVTMPVLKSASKQFFFLKGKKKKEIFGTVMAANIDPVEYPAHAILETGRSVWVTRW
jgi:6-phosphogluconolactonase